MSLHYPIFNVKINSEFIRYVIAIEQRGCKVLSEGLQEIMVKLPKNLLNEVDGLMKHENSDLSEFIYQATKNYLRTKKDEHIHQFRESMRVGYEEMAYINLTIASEAFQAEEEAEITLERAVIGV